MIRVGLVGFGIAGRVFHAPMITAVAGLELAAVVERSSREAEKRYPGVKTYASLESMLAAEELELIVIATPNTSHVPLATEALRAGRHVVVDKPVAITSAEVAQLIEEARTSGSLLVPYQNRRWDNGFRTLVRLLRESRVGRVAGFESTFDRWRPALRAGGVWREQALPGSGILLDLGAHLVDEALQLFGKPVGVSAEVACERDHAVANDSFTVRMRYESGLIATLSANCLATNARPHYTVRGTDGGYIKWGLDPQEAILKATFQVVDEGWGKEPEANWGVLTREIDGKLVEERVEPIPGDYRLFYAGVRDAILEGTPPPVEATDAWFTAKVLEYAEESAKARGEIVCDWSDAPRGLPLLG